MGTQRVKYNVDHAINAWKFFIVVAPDGMIVYVSRVMGGSESDKTHFNESEAPDLLEERYGKEGRSGEEGESERT